MSELRWMLFVDGENFTIRGQQIATQHDIELDDGPFFKRDNFLWAPLKQLPYNYDRATQQFVVGEGHRLDFDAIRAYYFTSVVGDDNHRNSVRESLHALGFSPYVFRRTKTRASKGVDIALTTEMLSHAFRGTYDVAVLVAA